MFTAVRACALRLACLLLVVPGALVADDGRLRIHGSNTIGETLGPALVEAWLREAGYRGIRRREVAFEEREIEATARDGSRLVVELHAHGSSTAFRVLVDGLADIGMSSRPVRPSEVREARALGRLDDPSQEVVLALDGLSIIVHPDNPASSLTVPQVRAVFSGEVRDWRELGGRPGRIALHARDDRSGTWDTFSTLVLQGQALAAGAKRYESTAELSEAVHADYGAIGFVGLSGIGRTRALAISDGAEALPPERFEVAVEDYPLSRRLYLYLPREPHALARSLLDFALSDAGQAVVQANGFVSQALESLHASARRGAPGGYLELVGSARRLSLNFRFGAGAAVLDTKAERDIDRLAQFMRQPGNEGLGLRLAGFADASEVLPYLAIALSSDRADYIAARLVARGVPVSRVRGFGGVLPVAANDNAAGRHRNRRVEVWLGPDPRLAAAGGRRSPASP